MIAWIAGSLGLVVFLAAVMLVQLGFLITFAVILFLFVPVIAGVIALHAVVTKMIGRHIAKGFG